MKEHFNKVGENPLPDELPSNRDQQQNDKDDREHFEFILGPIKIRCKRVTVRAIIAIALILGFTWLLVNR